MTVVSVRPEDILADNKDFVELNGLSARKGSIAAFLKNIDLFEDPDTSNAQKAASLAMIKELAPVIIATGLHKHATFKNKTVEDILNRI